MCLGTVKLGANKTSEYAREFPWLYEKIVNRAEIVSFSRWDDLPPEAATDRRHLEQTVRRSGLYIPLAVDGVVRYILAIISNTREQSWPNRIVERLKVLGGVFVNALGRKSVSLALRRNERSLAEAQRLANLGSWEWDVLTGNLWTSEQADLILGARAGTFAEFVALVHPDDRGVVRQAIDTALAQPGEKRRIEHRIIGQDGALRPLENHFEVLQSATGVPARVVGTLQDISERKQREQELQDLRAQQWHAARILQTGVLISSLAHELSQPLAAILSNAQAGLRLLAKNRLGRNATGEILTDIVADDKRAAQVIDSLRVMLRRQNTERKAIDAAQTVSDVLALLHSELVAHHAQVESDLAPGCLAMADKAQIQQVLINLVMNAIEAMQEQRAETRRLLLKVWAAGEDETGFSVADSGVGIAAERLDRAFEPFWTTKPRGLGMGLSICRSIVESHGGRIWAESGEGRGSTFSFTLPAAKS